MMGGTIKLLNGDDGRRKRGEPCGHLARHISQDSPFFKLSLLDLSDGEASLPSLDDNGEGGDCVSSFC